MQAYLYPHNHVTYTIVNIDFKPFSIYYYVTMCTDNHLYTLNP